MSWKKALLVGLVVLLVLAGLPLLMPGMGAACADCGPAVLHACSQVAVMLSLLVILALLATKFGARRFEAIDLLRALAFERPPQVA